MLFSGERSIKGNECAQILFTPPWFVEVFHMNTKGEEIEALGDFVDKWGIP